MCRSSRILHAENVLEGLSLEDVERVLRQAGVGLADLLDASAGHQEAVGV